MSQPRVTPDPASQPDETSSAPSTIGAADHWQRIVVDALLIGVAYALWALYLWRYRELISRLLN